MKNLILAAFLCLNSLFLSAGLPRQCDMDGKTEKIRHFEIVIPQALPVLNFAAKELQTYLGKVTGNDVPILENVSGKAFPIILGDNPLSRKIGLNPEKLADEGYFIVRRDNAIYILGKDHPTLSPEKNSWNQRYQRGTLSGVYDFLERFGDVRFYFPGEIGTVAEKKGYLSLPVSFYIVERPDYIARSYMFREGAWYEKNSRYDGVEGYWLNLVRLRMEEVNIPYAHGLAHRSYGKRFGKTHPEYFALLPDGSRYISRKPGYEYAPQLCFTSGIVDEIYQDAVSYFKGEPSSLRGAHGSYGEFWGSAAGGKYFSVMPNDAMYWCSCERCRKIARPGAMARTDEECQKLSNFVWQFTADLANRLKKDGIRGNITQMAYMPYYRIPECGIPDNVMVQVAVAGPGESDQRRDDKTLKDWNKKLNAKLNVWTYPGKHMGKALYAGIPAMLAKSTGEYFSARKDLLNGAFYESETDCFIFNYLNYYVLSKVLWDTSTDTNALLEEHARKMFGNAARPMRQFFDDLETLWLQVVGNTVQTALGPTPQLPSEWVFWTRIYTPDRLKQFNKYFDEAETLTKNDKDANRRVRFMREKMLGPILAASEKYRKLQDSFGAWECAIPGKVALRPCHGETAEVKTTVLLSETPEYYVFSYECEEPLMDQIRAENKKNDAPELYADSCVELFLNPSGDRKNYYHFIVNSNGALYDAKCSRSAKEAISDRGWNSGADVSASKKENSWNAVIKVPKKNLGSIDPKGFPVNFARHRALKTKPGEIYYQWSPAKNGDFHATEKYGLMKPASALSPNLLKDGDFDVVQAVPYRAGAWSLWRQDKQGTDKAELDDKIFITAGKSLHFTNTGGGSMNAVQWLPDVKPKTKYRLSFFVRTQDLLPVNDKGLGAGAFFSDADGKFQLRGLGRYTGTNPWFKESLEFVTPEKLSGKTAIGLWIWGAKGEAWFDSVKLEELNR